MPASYKEAHSFTIEHNVRVPVSRPDGRFHLILFIMHPHGAIFLQSPKRAIRPPWLHSISDWPALWDGCQQSC
jgi:hypothetical protein